MNKHIAFAFAGTALLAVPSFAEDQGAAIAAAAQEGTAAVSVPAEQFVSASLKVEEQLKQLGLATGYDRKRKAIIEIGTANLTMEKGVAGDDTFMLKRSAKATEAYLSAKAEIIKRLYSEMEATDQVSLNDGNPSEEELAVKAKIEEVKEKLAAFAEKAGKPELADADIDDALVDSLKELAFDPPAPEPQPAGDDAPPATSPANPLATERDSLVADVQAVIKDANSIPREPMSENTSMAKILSKMPLLGAKVLTQAESWDKTEKMYEMAMAVIWSPKLQEEAKNLATGNPTIAEKKGKCSVQEWIGRQDLLSMAGPWSFTDDEGKTIVIGISARDISGLPAPKLKKAKTEAETDARVAVATSLTCDLAAFTETSRRLAEYDDGSSEASSKVSDVVSSKTAVSLNGVGKLTSKEGYHPITGRKTYAVAYYLEPDLSKDAMERIKQMYADAITVTDASNFKKGQMAGMEASYDAAKESTEKFEKGKAEASADVEGRVRAAEVNVKTSGPQGSSGKNQIGEKGGVVSGVDLDTVDLDF